MLLWEAVGGKSSKTQLPVQAVQPLTSRLRGMRQENRCEAMTRPGRRCRCVKAAGSAYCTFHDPMLAAQLRERAAAKREARKRQLGMLPDGYLKTLTTPEGIATALDRLYREVRLGVVTPRVATIMLAIVDRLLEHDRLVATVGPRQVARKLRAQEVRRQVVAAVSELQAHPAPAVNTVAAAVPAPVAPAPAVV